MKIDEKALAERLAAEIPVAEKVVPDGGRILVPISIDELRMCIACLEAAKPQPAAPEVVALPSQVDPDWRKRCKELWQRLSRDQMLRQNDPVETIMEFYDTVWMEGWQEGDRTPAPTMDELHPAEPNPSAVEAAALVIEDEGYIPVDAEVIAKKVIAALEAHRQDTSPPSRSRRVGEAEGGADSDCRRAIPRPQSFKLGSHCLGAHCLRPRRTLRSHP